MFQLSHPDTAPGTGRTAAACRDANGYPQICGVKRERAIWIFKRPNGSYYSVPVSANAYSDECTIHVGAMPTPPEPGSDLVAVAHSHPASGKNHEPTYGACGLPSGDNIKLFPGEPGKQQGYIGIDSTGGGGSNKDWLMTGSAFGLDVYVMNKDNEIWKLPAYTPFVDRLKNTAQRRRLWRGNTNTTCNW